MSIHLIRDYLWDSGPLFAMERCALTMGAHTHTHTDGANNGSMSRSQARNISAHIASHFAGQVLFMPFKFGSNFHRSFYGVMTAIILVNYTGRVYLIHITITMLCMPKSLLICVLSHVCAYACVLVLDGSF